ncbi:MAG: prepilin-type N-terminal cleavage/methylation domain-containing protein [Candidatus Omnitrophota bacterium]|nr:prepilin-type N-terminal cleavage/methylation domain-containing protein [Candidatus Omnitrophota bacterium]
MGGKHNQRKHQQRTPLFLTGFTLIEVLVTTAVLSLGIVLIYRAFFTLLDSFGYYSNYLRVIAFADEKLWQAQDTLSCSGSDAGAGSSGRLNIQNKDFNWRLSVSEVGAGSNPPQLYRIDLAVNWHEGQRIRGLTRNGYALYIKKEE